MLHPDHYLSSSSPGYALQYQDAETLLAAVRVRVLVRMAKAGLPLVGMNPVVKA